jgi:hydrogenase maturation protease
MTPPLVIGLGNEMRGDDAAGLLAARRLAAAALPGVRVAEHPGDAASLAAVLAGERRVVVIDAVTGGAPGSVRELTPAALAGGGGWGSHGLGLAEAIALSAALGGAPQVRVIGIGGRRFGLGQEPSPEVVRAAALVARGLEEELACA